MIKITPKDLKKDDRSKVNPKNRSYSLKQKQTNFSHSLQEVISFNFQGNIIEELLEDLNKQERRFLETESQYELNRYKALVQKILKEIINTGFDTKNCKRSRRDKADFIIVNTINAKLAEIATEITKKTNKAFNLLKQIEEIRGLIFDLLY